MNAEANRSNTSECRCNGMVHRCFKRQLVKRNVWGTKGGNTTMAIVGTITNGSYVNGIGSALL